LFFLKRKGKAQNNNLNKQDESLPTITDIAGKPKIWASLAILTIDIENQKKKGEFRLLILINKENRKPKSPFLRKSCF
jgi:hypothetical protein